ncbi:MAG: CHC2 zinc finger domain-containing protein, partial [Halospina sp.]
MAGMIPQTFIETLRDRVDLAEIIGQRIPLKKSGGNYKAC